MSIDQPFRPRHSALASLRACGKIAAILLASAILMPAQWLLMRFTRGRAAFVLPRWWFSCLRLALGVRVEVVGTACTDGGTVFVGNHVSHYDIVVLGSLLRTRFIAKDDMERWPGMRFVGGLAQTLFISRQRRDAASVAANMAAQMRSDHDLVLFAEGTTSSGEKVAPFKSSLFSLFLGDRATTSALILQPFTLVIESVDGLALSSGGDRDIYAFHGDMEAGAHVRQFLQHSGAVVRVIFHPPMTVPPGTDRKTLAALTHAVVTSGLSSSQDLHEKLN